MDYVRKINAAILAFTTMDNTEVGAVKAGVTKQLLLDDNDVFMDLVNFYGDRELSAEGMKKPDTFREPEIRERLTNFVQLRAAIREAKERGRKVKAEDINFILRNVDEEEWTMYYNILSKKQGLLFTAEPLLADNPQRAGKQSKKKAPYVKNKKQAD